MATQYLKELKARRKAISNGAFALAKVSGLNAALADDTFRYIINTLETIDAQIAQETLQRRIARAIKTGTPIAPKRVTR